MIVGVCVACMGQVVRTPGAGARCDCGETVIPEEFFATAVRLHDGLDPSPPGGAFGRAAAAAASDEARVERGRDDGAPAGEAGLDRVEVARPPDVDVDHDRDDDVGVARSAHGGGHVLGDRP